MLITTVYSYTSIGIKKIPIACVCARPPDDCVVFLAVSVVSADPFLHHPLHPCVAFRATWRSAAFDFGVEDGLIKMLV